MIKNSKQKLIGRKKNKRANAVKGSGRSKHQTRGGGKKKEPQRKKGITVSGQKG